MPDKLYLRQCYMPPTAEIFFWFNLNKPHMHTTPAALLGHARVVFSQPMASSLNINRVIICSTH